MMTNQEVREKIASAQRAEALRNHFADEMERCMDEGLAAKVRAQHAKEDAELAAHREAKRASQMPPNNVGKQGEQPARRTIHSRDPKICKHQFANGRKVCPYCATTNPDM